MNRKQRIVTLAELECAATSIIEEKALNINNKAQFRIRVLGRNNNPYERTKQKANRLIELIEK